MPKKTINIPNLNCGHCVHTVEGELKELKGMIAAKADHTQKTAIIEWEEPPLNWEDIATLLKEIGYPAQI